METIKNATVQQSAKHLIKGILTTTAYYQLAASLLLASVFTTTTWAQQYQPPSGDPPSGPLVSNGSRNGCGEQYEIPLTVLAPTTHVGQTTTTTPTLTWFVPATDTYRVEVSFYTLDQQDQPNELVQLLEYVGNASGIVEFTLPTNESGLRADQRYLWQVRIACTPDSPIYDQSFVSVIDVKTPPAELTLALDRAQTPSEKADIYASAGYWYDALREARLSPDGLERNQLTQSLLAELVASESGQHGEFLTQIADHVD
ncbi:MAG: DUF928 domain-containing protein [Cyanobacteria bacterium J06635_1]